MVKMTLVNCHPSSNKNPWVDEKSCKLIQCGWHFRVLVGIIYLRIKEVWVQGTSWPAGWRAESKTRCREAAVGRGCRTGCSLASAPQSSWSAETTLPLGPVEKKKRAIHRFPHSKWERRAKGTDACDTHLHELHWNLVGFSVGVWGLEEDQVQQSYYVTWVVSAGEGTERK